MESEKRKLGRKNTQFDVAREFYIKGDYTSSGTHTDITFQQVADRFGVRVQTVWKKAQKDGWEQARSAYRQTIFDEERQYEEQIRAELRKAGLPAYAEFMSQIGRLCYSVMGRYLEALADDKSLVKISFSDVILACDRLERILTFLEGREKLDKVQIDYTWKEMILELANIPDDRTTRRADRVRLEGAQ